MKISLTIASLLALLAVAPDSNAVDAGPQLPAYRRVTLTNGLTLLLMEQHKVPMIAYEALVKAGSVADPVGQEGLAALTAQMLEKGTDRHTADQIATNLDFTGGSMHISCNPDYAAIRGDFLKKDSDTLLSLVAEILERPAFPAVELKKLVRLEIDEIKSEKEAARSVLPLYFDGWLFGSHPYGRPVDGDERSLVKLKSKALTAFYHDYYGPETTVLTLVGDFDSQAIERLVAEKFGPWKNLGRQGSKPPVIAEPMKGRTLLLVDKPDSTQTYFAIGNLGVARNNADRTGIQIVNLLFGGRFTSMLNEALRVNSGLTYGIRSGFTMHLAPGPFAITSFTRNATTTKALDMTLDILEKLHREGVSEDQLNSAKNYLKGQFPPQIETPGQLAGLLAEFELFGLNAREVNGLFQRIDAFSTTDAKRIIQQYFPRENLSFVLIGKASEIEESVKKYAPKMEKRLIDQPGF